MGTETVTEVVGTGAREDGLEKLARIIAKIDNEAMDTLEKFASSFWGTPRGGSDVG